ncbi:MAG: PQQ-dependent sugar dehydrogenase, partial [Thermomicrobiales bacterium]
MSGILKRMRTHITLILLLVTIVVPTVRVGAQTSDWDPSSFAGSYRLEEVFNGLSSPVAIIDPADGSGRLFVVEKTGTIRVAIDGSVLETPYLDISDLVSGQSEQGLLGLAFDPNFAENGRFY